MTDVRVLSLVKDFLEVEILKGQGRIELSTPLLAWGILDSLTTAQLTAYLEAHFEISISSRDVTGDNFKDLESVCLLVSRLSDDQVLDSGSV